MALSGKCKGKEGGGGGDDDATSSSGATGVGGVCGGGGGNDGGLHRNSLQSDDGRLISGRRGLPLCPGHLALR